MSRRTASLPTPSEDAKGNDGTPSSAGEPLADSTGAALTSDS